MSADKPMMFDATKTYELWLNHSRKRTLVTDSDDGNCRSPSADWLRDIGEACDDLGWSITRIEPSEIELVGATGTRVIIETGRSPLTGKLLRATLAVQMKR